ncbi:MAG: hypothetical protein ACLQF1_20305 [Methyloceanibacter sp.]
MLPALQSPASPDADLVVVDFYIEICVDHSAKKVGREIRPTFRKFSVADPDPASGREIPACANAISVPATIPPAALASVPMTVMPTTIVPIPMSGVAVASMTVPSMSVPMAGAPVPPMTATAMTMTVTAMTMTTMTMTTMTMTAMTVTTAFGEHFRWQHQRGYNSKNQRNFAKHFVILPLVTGCLEGLTGFT